MRSLLVEKQKALFLLLSLVFVSCAPKLPYSLNYPLTNETFFSRDGSFYGVVPQGWFASSGDTLAPALLAWLVKEDFSATLTLREIHVDQLSSDRIEKEGLALLANISAAAHRADSSTTDLIVPVKQYTMHSKTYCSYEVYNGDRHKRVVVFSARGKFYESEAIPVKGQWVWNDIMKLFMAQQAFLASLVF